MGERKKRMIVTNPDGSLTYKDATGNSVTASIFESDDYARVAAILGKQQNAAANNINNLKLYNLNLASSQAQITRGVTVPAPTKPLMEVVDDQGNDTMVPFVPPLADLVQSTVPVIPSGGIAATTNLPPDEPHLTYLMVKALYAKTFPAA
jgi:hypothetical protein